MNVSFRRKTKKQLGFFSCAASLCDVAFTLINREPRSHRTCPASTSENRTIRRLEIVSAPASLACRCGRRTAKVQMTDKVDRCTDV